MPKEEFPVPLEDDVGRDDQPAAKKGTAPRKRVKVRTRGSAKKDSPTTAARSEAGGGSIAPAPRGVSKELQSALNDVQADLAERVTQVGGVLLPVSPIPGGYVIASADEAARLITRIASRNPRLLARLMEGSDVADYLGLGMLGAGLLVAVGVQYGRLPWDGVLAKQWKIDEIALDIADEMEKAGANGNAAPDAGPTAGGSPEPDGGPAFGPVDAGPDVPPRDVGAGAAL